MFKLFVSLLPYEWLGAFITALRYILVVVFRTDYAKVQNLIDNINRELIKDDRYNRFVLENPKLLAIRVESEVDGAIKEFKDLTGHTEEVKVDEAVFTEDPFGETELGGDLRLTSPWDTNNNQQEL